MGKILYIGCFFDPEKLEKALAGCQRTPLSQKIEVPHVTFAFRPETVPAELFGTAVTVRAVGYGNDGANEALAVEFLAVPEGLEALASRIPVPHITLSVSKTGKPVNSRYLTFTPMEPITLTGRFGGMEVSGRVCYSADAPGI